MKKINMRLHLARLAGRLAEKAEAGKSRLPPGATEFLAAGRRQVNPFSMAFMRALSKQNDNGCLEWQGAKDTSGYGIVVFFGETWSTHRASYFLNHGDIPPGLIVMHKCDNPRCINPDHLMVGNKKDNAVDCAKKFRGGSQKVSDRDAMQIRAEYAAGINQFVLAEKYGMTQSNVSRIISNERFAHV